MGESTAHLVEYGHVSSTRPNENATQIHCLAAINGPLLWKQADQHFLTCRFRER